MTWPDQNVALQMIGLSLGWQSRSACTLDLAIDREQRWLGERLARAMLASSTAAIMALAAEHLQGTDMNPRGLLVELWRMKWQDVDS